MDVSRVQTVPELASPRAFPQHGRTAFLIVGPPNSGGGAMARVLFLAGVRLPRDLAAASTDHDPDGSLQSISVTELNNAILAQDGGSASEPPFEAPASEADVSRALDILQRMFAADAPIAIRDPRLCFTADVWVRALEERRLRPFFILMHRPPAAVAGAEQPDLDGEAADSLWRRYAQRLLQLAASYPHAVVSRADLLEDPRGVLERLQLPEPSTGWASFTQAASAFLSGPARRPPHDKVETELAVEDQTLLRELDQRSTEAPVFAGAVKSRLTRSVSEVSWLLISGAPRSGTSLLRALVDDHPDVSILQEFGLTRFVRGLAHLVGRPPIIHPPWAPFAGTETALAQAAAFYETREAAGGAGSHGDLGSLTFNALAQGVFSALKGTQPAVIGDKMPMRGEWEDLDDLHQRLPGLRLLITLRNPVDVIHSSMIRRSRQQLGGDFWPIASVQEAAEEWWLAWRRTAALVERFGPAVHLVKYEALCDDVQGVMSGIWDWLDLPNHRPATVVRQIPSTIDGFAPGERDTVRNLLGDVAETWGGEPDPYRLLARFAGAPRPYVPDRRVHASAEEADALLVEGFSWREPWGRWTDGDRALLRLRHGLSAGLGRLELQVARAIVPQGGACDVVIRIDDAPPQLFSLGEGPGRIALLCPLENRTSPGVLNVELLVLSPKGANDPPPDDRRLGVGLESLRLSVLP